MDSKKSSTLKEFILFNLIGAVNTLLGLVLYFLLIYCGTNYVVALCADYIFGIAFSFFMNKTYTFRINEKSSVAMFSKMVLVYGLLLFANIILLVGAVEMVGLNEYLAQIISFGILIFAAFFGQKKIVFRNRGC